MYCLPMACVFIRLIWLVLALCCAPLQAAPAAWKDDLQPLPNDAWNRERAALNRLLRLRFAACACGYIRAEIFELQRGRRLQTV